MAVVLAALYPGAVGRVVVVDACGGGRRPFRRIQNAVSDFRRLRAHKPVRSGTVTFQTTVNGEFTCGAGCFATRTVTATSWAQTVTVP